MKISVRVQPRSSKQAVIKQNDTSYRVYVHSPPENNRANEELKELLAKFFKIRKSGIIIVKGERTRNKIVEI